MFHKADADGGGTVQLNEAQNAIKNWAKGEGITLSQTDVLSLTGLYEDAAGPDGSLDEKQYVQFATKVKQRLNRQNWESRLKTIFDNVDADNKGYVSYQDARTALEAWADQNKILVTSKNLEMGRLIYRTWIGPMNKPVPIDFEHFKIIAN